MENIVDRGMSIDTHYYIDSELYLDRYKQLSKNDPSEDYYDISWNIALFTDLMMSYECLLKSWYYLIYKQTIKSHNVLKISKKVLISDFFSSDKPEDEDNDDYVCPVEEFLEKIKNINSKLPSNIKKVNYRGSITFPSITAIL